jgi:two-component system chemotaxis response regulator CheB
MVVDDSGFFRRRIEEILNEDGRIEVIGSAANGKEAVEKVSALNPDVITMDIEMPVMDGITAVQKIMQANPVPILMFSSLTTEGAEATLKALEAGAMDFLPKKMEDISLDRAEAARILRARVRLLAARGLGKTQAAVRSTAATRPKPAVAPRVSRRKGEYKLVAIGTSTGGPVALQSVLTKLPANFPVPILMVQHMPASFTPAFAQRLDSLCKIHVKEAADGDELKAGTAYLAPGGKQMLVEKRGALPVIRITDGDIGQHYKPCVDITFGSVSRVFTGNVLAIIMTGMGADGREGSRVLKQSGSSVWAQDEASSVIYGMPAAVAEAGLAEQILPLDQIGARLVEAV